MKNDQVLSLHHQPQPFGLGLITANLRLDNFQYNAQPHSIIPKVLIVIV